MESDEIINIEQFGEGPDFVETLWINLVPIPWQHFFSETQKKMSSIDESHQGLWWSLSEVVRIFKMTKCARWTFCYLFPVLCEVREVFIDKLCVTQFGSVFAASFGFSMIIMDDWTLADCSRLLHLSPENSRACIAFFKKICHFKLGNSLIVNQESVHDDNRIVNDQESRSSAYKPLRASLTFCINLAIPLVFVKLIPKFFCSASSPSWLYFSGLAIATGTGFGQGIFSYMRCKQKMILATNSCYQMTPQRKISIQQVLPLLPVRVKMGTVELLVSLWPHFLRGTIIFGHLYPLWSLSGRNDTTRGRGFLVDISLLFFGLIGWLKLGTSRKMF